MDRLLYLAMTGASQNTMAIQAHSNNLANISTSGFRRDFEQARSMQTFGESYPSRVYSMSERPGTDFTPGTLQETGRDLDVAIQGNGWIAVQGADGKEAYVRTGSLKVDALGMLRTAMVGRSPYRPISRSRSARMAPSPFAAPGKTPMPWRSSIASNWSIRIRRISRRAWTGPSAPRTASLRQRTLASRWCPVSLSRATSVRWRR